MSDTARPKTTKNKLSANEVNQDLPTVMTAGETINGVTTPVPLYLNSSDGEVYACAGDDETKLNFIGFGVSDGTDGNDITVQNHGVVSGFSSLSVGSYYYVQNDGSLGTQRGTYGILVGVAVSSTQIMILKNLPFVNGIIASDELQESADIEDSIGGATPTKVKSIIVRKTGILRVKFDIKNDNGDYAHGRIYIGKSDGTTLAVGTEQTNTTTSYATYSEDIYVQPGDTIELYVYQAGGSGTMSWRNFRIYFTNNILDDTETILNT